MAGGVDSRSIARPSPLFPVEMPPMTPAQLWHRYQQYLCRVEALDFALDISRMKFDDTFMKRMAPALEQAYAAMDALEGGAVANPDEKRMVGHYWLRAAERAP